MLCIEPFGGVKIWDKKYRKLHVFQWKTAFFCHHTNIQIVNDFFVSCDKEMIRLDLQNLIGIRTQVAASNGTDFSKSTSPHVWASGNWHVKIEWISSWFSGIRKTKWIHAFLWKIYDSSHSCYILEVANFLSNDLRVLFWLQRHINFSENCSYDNRVFVLAHFVPESYL